MNPSDTMIGETLRRAVRAGHLRPPNTAVVFYDLSHVGARLSQLKRCFPADALHAVAIKACPLEGVLRRIVKQGFGLEAASLPELWLAESAGAPPSHIVFDSPAKTREELEYALTRGVHINADSIPELDRIAQLLKTGVEMRGTVGIRVNPQVGIGTISATSVAGEYSKFGVPLREQHNQILQRFAEYNWLTGLHLHIGSQGCALPMLIEGIKRVVLLADEIDTRLRTPGQPHRVKIFDIGGGLPVAYRASDECPSMDEYSKSIQQNFPSFVTPGFRLMTEFGRWIFANGGWVASRVEYIKQSATTKTAIIHVGADMFLRKCYRPTEWHHDILVFTSDGRLKQGYDDAPYVVAGPLCFAGDILGSGLRLPPIAEGDILVLKDAGAYTLSMWSRYNSRQVPTVLAYSNPVGEFEILRHRDTLQEVAAFWSQPKD